MNPKSPPKPSAGLFSAGKRYVFALGAVVVGFALVRLPGLFNDLWLDEIWSINLVSTISAPWEILTKLHHDNNHPLNSLFIYLMMPVEADWMYRLFSWCAGSATVWLAALIAARQYRLLHPTELNGREKIAGIMTAVVVGGAFLLIHYSSEARGYAPALAFGLLALYAMQRATENCLVRWAVLYGVGCVLGLLSHLATIQVMIAGVGWTGCALFREHGPWRVRLTRAIGWHLGPWLFFMAYYLGFVRKMEIGGGTENPLIEVLNQVAVFTLGFPVSLGWVALPVFFSALFASLILIGRRSTKLGVFYGLVILVTPVLGMLFSRFTLLFPRYFFISVGFALLILGYGLVRLWFRQWGLRIMVATGLALFILGNGLNVSRLWHNGRGQYRVALREIAARTPFAEITIGSDHDFRNYMLVDYYRVVVGPSQKIIYYPTNQQPPWGVQWLLLHRLDGDSAPAAKITDAKGNRYVQERFYSHAPLSGWDWYVYRNEQLRPTG